MTVHTYTDCVMLKLEKKINKLAALLCHPLFKTDLACLACWQCSIAKRAVAGSILAQVFGLLTQSTYSKWRGHVSL